MIRHSTRNRRSRLHSWGIETYNLLLEPLEPRTLFSVAPTPADLVAQASNAFAFDLYQELRTSNTGNIFFSPYSISTALELALQGARGDTATQIIQTLYLPESSLAQAGIQSLFQLFQADPATAGYTLSTANRLWVKDNFNLLESFLTNAQNLFGAAAQSIDFSDPQAAATTINNWVSDQTHGKITNLIPADAISDYTRLILTNAIYFKGDWAHAFDQNSTQEAPFQSSPDQSNPVEMMSEQSNFGYYAQSGPNGFQALDLPYQGNNVDMLVILPTDPTLNNFQSTMNADLFSQITSNLHFNDVRVFLPQFQLNETYDLVKPLQDLGMTAAFNNADFSGISENEQLGISDIIHKSFIKVDEKGTEAAAATGITVRTSAIAFSQPIIFRADHPFMFAIRDRSTNTILFLGQVTDPGNAPTSDDSKNTPRSDNQPVQINPVSPSPTPSAPPPIVQFLPQPVVPTPIVAPQSPAVSPATQVIISAPTLPTPDPTPSTSSTIDAIINNSTPALNIDTPLASAPALLLTPNTQPTSTTQTLQPSVASTANTDVNTPLQNSPLSLVAQQITLVIS